MSSQMMMKPRCRERSYRQRMLLEEIEIERQRQARILENQRLERERERLVQQEMEAQRVLELKLKAEKLEAKIKKQELQREMEAKRLKEQTKEREIQAMRFREKILEEQKQQQIISGLILRQMREQKPSAETFCFWGKEAKVGCNGVRGGPKNFIEWFVLINEAVRIENQFKEEQRQKILEFEEEQIRQQLEQELYEAEIEKQMEQERQEAEIMKQELELEAKVQKDEKRKRRKAVVRRNSVIEDEDRIEFQNWGTEAPTLLYTKTHRPRSNQRTDTTPCHNPNVDTETPSCSGCCREGEVAPTDEMSVWKQGDVRSDHVTFYREQKQHRFIDVILTGPTLTVPDDKFFNPNPSKNEQGKYSTDEEIKEKYRMQRYVEYAAFYLCCFCCFT